LFYILPQENLFVSSPKNCHDLTLPFLGLNKNMKYDTFTALQIVEDVRSDVPFTASLCSFLAKLHPCLFILLMS